jgi:hypothetical protein
MTTNPNVNWYHNTAEQGLVESLMVEAIKFYGIDCLYIPRTVQFQNQLLEEDLKTKFEYAIPVEMYVKTVDGFEGQYEFVSKFGIQFEKQITLTVARSRWKAEYDLKKASPLGGATYPFSAVRPMEGDLIYMPLLDKVFEIKMTQHEQLFYQIGSLYTYDLICEVFDFSAEDFSTGNTIVDDIFDKFDSNFGNSVVGLNVEAEVPGQNETLDNLANTIVTFDFNNPFA